MANEKLIHGSQCADLVPYIATFTDAINNRICREVGVARNYTDEQTAALETKIAGLKTIIDNGNIAEIQANAAKIQEVFDALDVNGDGDFNDIAGLVEKATEALALAKANESVGATNAAQITTTSNQVTSLGVQVTDLKSQIDNLVDSDTQRTDEEIRALAYDVASSVTCEQNNRLVAALQAGIDKLESNSCVFTPSGSGDTASGGAGSL